MREKVAEAFGRWSFGSSLSLREAIGVAEDSDKAVGRCSFGSSLSLRGFTCALGLPISPRSLLFREQPFIEGANSLSSAPAT